MPFDPNDRESVNQFTLRARNEGHSDEEIIEYIRKQRVSSAGSTLQSARFGTHPTQETSPAPRTISPIGTKPEAIAELGTAFNAAPFLPGPLGVAGQAAKEGFDYLTKPEGEKPTWYGAGGRITAVAAAPKIVEKGSKLIGKSVGFAKPAMNMVAQSGMVKAAKTLYGKLAPGAEEQLGTEIATTTSNITNKGLQPTAIAKDKFVDELDKQGKRIPVEKFAATIKGAIQEAETFGSDKLKQGAKNLDRLAEELLSKRQEGTVGLGEFMTFKENLSKQLDAATNSVLRYKLGILKNTADDTLIQALGPGSANHIKALEIATTNRLGVLRKVNKMFRLHPEAVIKKAAGNEEVMRAINELDAQTGTNFAEAINELATKKSFSPKEMPIAYKLLDRMTRIAGSSAIGFAEGGPMGFLAYLASSPPMRRQAAKLGLLLSTTPIPQATAAAVAKTSE